MVVHSEALDEAAFLFDVVVDDQDRIDLRQKIEAARNGDGRRLIPAATFTVFTA